MIALLSSVVLAAQPIASVGAELTVNDPFVSTRGSHLGVDVALWPWLRIGVAGGLYPSLGEADWTGMTAQIVDYNISPDISRMVWRGAGQATLLPLRQSVGDRERLLGVVVGMGAVHTEDDLAMLQAEDDPHAIATARQIHPITHVGLIGEVWWGDWGGRLRMERSSYTEVVFETVQESKVPAWVGIDVVRRWP